MFFSVLPGSQVLKFGAFSIFPGSELKLLKGLELGCTGIITATCNVTAQLSRKVYDDFFAGNKQTHNHKLCEVRGSFDNYNLISGLHSYYSKGDIIYKNILLYTCKIIKISLFFLMLSFILGLIVPIFFISS